jgi:hypothetical protein
MMPDLVRKRLTQQLKRFLFRRTGKAWDKCISVGGGYVEKYIFFFQVRISHVLRFISICDY